MVNKQLLLLTVTVLFAQQAIAQPENSKTVSAKVQDHDSPEESIEGIEPTSILLETKASETEDESSIYTGKVEFEEQEADEKGKSKDESKKAQPSKEEVDDEQTECLNTCSEAAYLAALENTSCADINPNGFYQVARKCALCICSIWNYMEDKDILIKGMKKCGITAPGCITAGL